VLAWTDAETDPHDTRGTILRLIDSVEVAVNRAQLIFNENLLNKRTANVLN